MTVAFWLEKAVRLFRERGVPEPEANSEFLMAHVLSTGRAMMRLRGGDALSSARERIFSMLVRNRARRVPLSYVLGRQPFLDFELFVGPGVLIPRPETEELTFEVLRLLRLRSPAAPEVLEIGTGSGAIAIALARELPAARVTATDVSPVALRYARVNAARLLIPSPLPSPPGGEGWVRGRKRIRFVLEDIFDRKAPARPWADLVVSNPPYIPSREMADVASEVLREPRLALEGGADGLRTIRAVIRCARRELKAGGWLALEIHARQGVAVRRLLESRGLERVSVRADSQGLDRMVFAQKIASHPSPLTPHP